MGDGSAKAFYDLSQSLRRQRKTEDRSPRPRYLTRPRAGLASVLLSIILLSFFSPAVCLFALLSLIWKCGKKAITTLLALSFFIFFLLLVWWLT